MEVEEWLNTNNRIQIDIFNNKYRYNGESFEDWLKRVSAGDEDLARLIRERKFLFGGRVLANRGITDTKITYSNCYVIPIEDNIRGIFKAAGDIAETYSRGGGCGLNLSNLAPKGIQIHNAAKTSSGALSFAEIYDLTTATIGQEGRRGALMLSISSEHPDLAEFISAKNDLKKLNHANLSIMASNAFMEAVIQDGSYELSFIRDTGTKTVTAVKAREIFNELVKNNYDTGEPGILFWDTIKKYSMVSENPEFKLEGVNPCGEVPLIAFGACNLGSFNLIEYAYKDEDTYIFDFDEFEKDIYIAVRAMNDVLDEGLPLHPLSEQREAVAKWRMIGIGVMSFADLLIKMGYKYGDEKSIGLASEIACTLLNTAVKASADLAAKYGPYPGYDRTSTLTSNFFIENLTGSAQKMVKEYGLRNATLLSIAPTGSISTLLGCSNGIEPIFAEKCKRRTESLHKKSVTYEVYSSAIQEVVNSLGIKEGEPLPDYVVTTMKIDPMDRIQMQATWQQYIDSSISSTINLPNSATEEDIYNIYIEAWKQNLKGVTVFREGCKREGILTTSEPQKIEVDYKAPDITFGPQDRVSVACGHFLCAVTGVGEQPLKVVNSATTGCCEANLLAIQRVCSLALRSGVSPELLTEQLDKVTCKACVNNPAATSKSCAAGISKVIKLYAKFYKAVGPINLDQPAVKAVNTNTGLVECPECHEKSIQTAKCFTCSNCGYSRCS